MNSTKLGNEFLLKNELLPGVIEKDADKGFQRRKLKT